MTVYPLAHAHGRLDQHLDDGATRYVLVAVELRATTIANANGARDRIGGHARDGSRAQGECFEHVSFVVDLISIEPGRPRPTC